MVNNFLFPKHCVGCGVSGYYLCSSCKSFVTLTGNEVCVVCGKPSEDGFTHLKCRNKLTPDRFISLYVYKGITKKIINTARNKKAFRILDPLLDLYVKDLKAGGISFGPECFVVPIPLHLGAFFKQGFNQAEYIARKLSLKLGLIYRNDILIKVSNSTLQNISGKNENNSNLQDIFKILKSRKNLVRGRDIVLVDDVFHSKIAFLSASKILKEAGARYIYCLCLAKD